MKKLFSLLLIVFCLISCTSDSEGFDVENYDGPLKINGHLFQLGADPEDAETFYDAESGQRMFRFSNGLYSASKEAFTIWIPAASEAVDVSGNYTFNTNGNSESWFTTDYTGHSIFFGTLSIQDQQNGTYRIQYHNVRINDGDINHTIYKIAGYVETTFSPAQ
ncbi:hypothetical protein HUK80_03600 [Flavobacterium sp. MAH-1]|uniref:Uncharacterized protein n=1 Tax=Flavobacterium agri TaxID=2743471 RepID=A0A7Y9C543_9FLAO|nr:hypothetical protein [Flavobacterium agri]NUY79969.1 hypothetical protein [Flavobacterium agri]NYA69994.1 hypothetical protein [Flavobacterium agri]